MIPIIWNGYDIYRLRLNPQGSAIQFVGVFYFTLNIPRDFSILPGYFIIEKNPPKSGGIHF